MIAKQIRYAPLPLQASMVTSSCSKPPAKRLIIINSEQFGYNPATYYYCKYLRNIYEVVYIGWDHGLEKLFLDNVTVAYVSREGNRLKQLKRLISTILSHTADNDTIILIKYSKGIAVLIRFLRPFNPSILDIRTGSVARNALHRCLCDLAMRVESVFFRNITIISAALAGKLGLAGRARVLPLGADVLSSTNKTFDRLDLLYVGTLFNRGMDKAVKGFMRFYRDYAGKVKMRFTIVGGGPDKEEVFLRGMVAEAGLAHIIDVHGSVPHDRLKCFFDQHNVGLSYIPITPYYELQPATKTFEYLLAGMPVLATATTANKCVIKDENGVVVGDSVEAFYQGLVLMHHRLGSFNSEWIRARAQQYTWAHTAKTLQSYLEGIDGGAGAMSGQIQRQPRNW